MRDNARAICLIYLHCSLILNLAFPILGPQNTPGLSNANKAHTRSSSLVNVLDSCCSPIEFQYLLLALLIFARW